MVILLQAKLIEDKNALSGQVKKLMCQVSKVDLALHFLHFCSFTPSMVGDQGHHHFL